MSYNLLIDGEVVGPVDQIEATLEDGTTQHFKVPILYNLSINPTDDGVVIDVADFGVDEDGYDVVTVHPIPGDHIGKDIPRKAAATITPTEVDQKILAGQYLTGDQTINAIPATYIGSGVPRRSATTITPSESQQIIPAGVYLDGAQTINPIPDNYIIPSGSMTITSNGEVDVTAFAKVVVNIAAGIIPIGDLTADLLTRPTGAGGGTITIPAGYYVKNELTISNWKSGQISGNGTSGGTFQVPYSTIGFIPTYAALVANSDSVKAANTIIAVFGDNGSGRAINTGNKASLSTTYALEASAPKVTLNSNGITFPAISGKAYGKFNYRWFALR